MKYLLVLILIILSSCQTIFVTQHDIEYTYKVDEEIIKESGSFIWYTINNGEFVGKMPNNKILTIKADSFKILKDFHYEIRL